MSYVITHSDGTAFLTLADQQTNATACSLTLVGRGAANYGTIIAQDFVALVENFASLAAPAFPLEGQLWWDKAGQNLRVYDATGTWENIGLGGKLSGFDGAIIPNTLSVRGEGVGFQNVNPNAPANSTRFRTSVLDDGSWVLQALNDDGSLKSTPLAVDRFGALSTLLAVSGEAATATRLGQAVAITLTGQAGGTVQFDGSADVSLPVTLAASGVVPGTYLSVVVDASGRVTAGGGLGIGAIRIAGDVVGAGADNITVNLTATGVAVGSNGTGTYSSVVVDSKGRVLAGFGLTATGDVRGVASGGSIALSLANVPGLTAGTYGAVAVDATGRVVQGLSLQQAALVNALGFTPVNAAGGSMTGALIISPPTSDGRLLISAGTSNRKVVSFATNGVSRFDAGVLSSGEFGGNTGSDFSIGGYDDTGTSFSAALTIVRATGAINTGGAVTVGGDLTVTGAIVGTLTGNVIGNAATASKLSAPRAFTLNGDASGSASFDGSNAPVITVSLTNQPAITAGTTYTSVVLNAKGVVVAAGNGVPVPGSIGAYTIWSSSGTSLAVGQSYPAASVGQSVGTYVVMGETALAGSTIYLLGRTA